MGGTIMGTSAANSVVNSFGQTHEIPNLYMAGPGIFTTSGASNPTYTIFRSSAAWRRAACKYVEHGCGVRRALLHLPALCGERVPSGVCGEAGEGHRLFCFCAAPAAAQPA